MRSRDYLWLEMRPRRAPGQYMDTAERVLLSVGVICKLGGGRVLREYVIANREEEGALQLPASLRRLVDAKPLAVDLGISVPRDWNREASIGGLVMVNIPIPNGNGGMQRRRRWLVTPARLDWQLQQLTMRVLMLTGNQPTLDLERKYAKVRYLNQAQKYCLTVAGTADAAMERWAAATALQGVQRQHQSIFLPSSLL